MCYVVGSLVSPSPSATGETGQAQPVGQVESVSQGQEDTTEPIVAGWTPEGAQLIVGRVTPDLLAAWMPGAPSARQVETSNPEEPAAASDDNIDRMVLACGPPGLVEHVVRDALTAQGWDVGQDYVVF